MFAVGYYAWTTQLLSLLRLSSFASVLSSFSFLFSNLSLYFPRHCSRQSLRASFLWFLLVLVASLTLSTESYPAHTVAHFKV